MTRSGSERGEKITVHLDSLAFGGDAVGRAEDGRVIFVAGGAPGERVDVQLFDQKRSYARGRLLAIVEPAPCRVTPPCVLADRCGGCPWQHVDEATQLSSKQEIVRRALAKGHAPVLPILRAPASLGYRTRARMSVSGGRIGFLARKSNQIVAVDTCPALAKSLDRALAEARDLVGDALGDDAEMVGLCAADGRVHLALTVGRGADDRRLDDGAARLVGRAGISGVVVRRGRAERIFGGATPERIFGDATIDLELGREESFHGSAAGFAQANLVQNELLRKLVCAAAQAERACVLELYAGDGNFTRDLARIAARGVAVEGDREAAARLRMNLDAVAKKQSRALDWTFRAQAVDRAVVELVSENARFDRVVLDPPRAGAAEILDGLVALAPARIVYVSCDPMTLGRDVERLTAHGYRVESAQPIDMMPHTAHIEVVCTLVASVPPFSRAANRA